jgi:hypothetical protein
MKHPKNFPTILIVSSLGLLFIATPAYGYVDPNSAGLLSQILTPLLIASAAGLTFLRRRVGEVLSGLWRLLRRRADV